MENEKDQSKVENNKAEDNQVHPLYIDLGWVKVTDLIKNE